MFKDNYSVKNSLKKLFLQRYERYLPTAFDESMTILEKMNKLIEAQNALIDVVNAHTEFTSDQIERAFDIVDENLDRQLAQFRDELEEQKILYEEIRDTIHSDLLPDTVKQKLEEWLLNGTIEDMINGVVFADFNERIELTENKFLYESITLRVPSQYNDLNEAFNRASEYVVMKGVWIDVLMESGYLINSPLYLQNGDYSHMTISSEDDVVKCGPLINNRDLLYFRNCHAPTLNCLIDGDSKNNTGIRVIHNSAMRINAQCGVINSGGDNLFVRNASTVTAMYGIFTGASQVADQGAGITSWGASSVSAYGADVSGSKWYGVRSAHSSLLEFDDGIANNCGRHNIRASQGARLTCRHADARNAGVHGVYALDASVIHADGVDVSGAEQTGIFASGSSTIQADTSIANNCGRGAVAEYSSTVNVLSIKANDCSSRAIRSAYGSKMNARNAELNDTRGFAVDCIENSTINMQNSSVYRSLLRGLNVTGSSTVNATVSIIRDTQRGNESAHGVYVRGLSFVDVSSSHCWNNGGLDLRIEGGSHIRAENTYTSETAGTDTRTPHLNDTNVSSFNTLGRFGVIFN